MMLSFKAERLYEVLKKRGNGLHPEISLRDPARMSHGTFTAARKELIEEGLLTVTYQGRKPYYEVHIEEDSQIEIGIDAAEEPASASFCDLRVNRPMPRLTGAFDTLFHWSDSISIAIGGDIDLTPVPDCPGVVRLYSYKHRKSHLYHIEEGEDFVTVREKKEA